VSLMNVLVVKMKVCLLWCWEDIQSHFQKTHRIPYHDWTKYLPPRDYISNQNSSQPFITWEIVTTVW